MPPLTRARLKRWPREFLAELPTTLIACNPISGRLQINLVVTLLLSLAYYATLVAAKVLAPAPDVAAATGVTAPYVFPLHVALFLLLPIQYALTAFAHLEEVRRLAPQRGWRVTPLRDAARTAWLFIFFIGSDVFLCWLARVGWLDRTLSYDCLHASCLWALLPIGVGIALDRFTHRRLAFLTLGLALALVVRGLAAVHWLSSFDYAMTLRTWGTDDRPLRVLATLAVVALIMSIAMSTLIVLVSGRPTTSRTKYGSPTKHMQLRYLKAAMVFGIVTGLLTMLTSVVHHNLLANESGLRIITRLGYAWALCLPLTLLSALVTGMVFLHDSARGRVARLDPREPAGSSVLKRGWAVARSAFAVLLDHISTATTIAAAVIIHHPIQVATAVLINVACSIYYALLRADPPLSGFVLVNVWCTSYVAWTAPFMTAITDLHASLGNALRVYVSQTLGRADNHVVLAGYGDLGRRVLRLLYATDDLNIALYENSWDIILPDGRRGFVLCDLTLVESDVASFAFTAQSGDVQVGLIRLHQLLVPKAHRTDVEHYAFAVCGDIKNAQIFDVARVASARSFLCLVRDSAAVYAVSDHIKREKPVCRSVLAVDSPTPRHFLAHRSVQHPVVMLDVAQLRAAQIAQAATILAPPAREEARLRVVVVSDTAQALNFVDEFVKITPQESRVTILGDIPDMRLRATGTADDSGRRRIVFQRRMSNGSVPRALLAGITVDYIECQTSSPNVLQGRLRELRPHLVVVMQHDATAALEVTRAVVIAAARLASRGGRAQRLVPRLLLAAETGRTWRAMSLGDAALHHTRLTCAPARDHLAFPRHYGAADHHDGVVIGDAIVDVLDDPASRILAAFQAQRESHPVEFAVCLRNRAGSLVRVLNSFAGLIAHSTRRGMVPSFAGVRLSVGPGETTLLSSTCRLEKYDEPPALPVRRAALLPLGGRAERLTESIVDRFGLTDDYRRWNGPTSWATKDCPRMETCAAAQHCNGAEVRAVAGKIRLSPYYWADHDGDAAEASAAAPPSARLSVLTDRGRKPGSLARVLNAMLFCTPMEVEADQLVNIFGLSVDPCHESRYAVMTVYGALEARGRDCPTSAPLAFDILIRPRRQKRKWLRYSRALARFVNTSQSQKAQVWTVSARPASARNALRPALIWITTRPRDRSYLHQVVHGTRVRCTTCTDFGPCRLCMELRAALERAVHVDRHPEQDLTIRVWPRTPPPLGHVSTGP